MAKSISKGKKKLMAKDMPMFCAPMVHETAVSFLDKLSGKLLDLGCGSGALSERIHETYGDKFDIYASDFNKKLYLGSRKFVENDLNNGTLPFNSSTFNVVMLIEVIEHVENPAKLLEEIHRILKKNGVLIMSTPNVENLQSRIHFLFQGRFFSFLKSDTSKNDKIMGMGHVNPMFDFQLHTLTSKKFKRADTRYNRIRIPLLKHKISALGSRLLGEIKIIKLAKI